MTNYETKEGFSDYTRQLVINTRELTDKTFPFKKELESKPLEKSAEKLIRNLVEHCLIFVLSKSSLEEQESFKKQDLNLVKVMRLALEKASLSEEERNQIEGKLKEISVEDFKSPSKIVSKFDLLNDQSPIPKFKKKLYNLFKEKPEATEAYTYLSWEAISGVT